MTWIQFNIEIMAQELEMSEQNFNDFKTNITQKERCQFIVRDNLY